MEHTQEGMKPRPAAGAKSGPQSGRTSGPKKGVNNIDTTTPRPVRQHGEVSDEELDGPQLPPSPPNKYQPFPIHTLPGPVGDFVRAASKAIGCDAAFVALPLLACLALAIGNKRVIRLKRTWTEPAIIWAAIVGKSGSHKTPAIQVAMQFLTRRQAKAIAKHLESLARFEQETTQYERDIAAWKRTKSSDLPPEKPQEPVCTRYITSDCTIEALAALLAVQFDGLLVTRDELAGWLGGIAEYKGGKGSDLGHWLAMWSAAPLTVDRKTGAIRMIHVPRAAVSLVGGVQPGVLRVAIGHEHMQDGLCARLLLAMPEPRPVTWTDDTVDPAIEEAMGEVFDRLLVMEPAINEQGESEPLPLDLTPEAKTVWVKYYNRHRAELVDLDDDLAAAWSKLEAYSARFALIFQLCTWAAGDASAGHQIDEASMTAAIALSEWFGGEAKRVYGLIVETAEDREQRELVELICRKGGRTTVREIAHSSRRYRRHGEAEAALGGLARAGLGQWEHVSPGPLGGRPTRVFRLSATGDGTKTTTTQGKEEVSVPGPVEPLPPEHHNYHPQEKLP